MRAGALFAAALGVATAVQAQPATPLWRMHTENLAMDRALVQDCLSTSEQRCANVVQAACAAPIAPEDPSPAEQRRCDWRAIAAWEDEMEAELAVLRTRLGGDDLRRLNESQSKWEASMLADVALGMDFYEGGSLAGPVGAHIRAQATETRTVYLYEMRMMTDDQ